MVHSLYQSLNNLETIYADRIGIRYYDEAKGGVVEVPFRQYAADLRRFVAFLRSRTPNPLGQRVAILARNSYHYVMCMYGAVLAGAVAVPLNTGKNWDEIRYELDLVEPVCVLHDGEYLSREPALGQAYGDRLVPMDAFTAFEPAMEITEVPDLSAMAFIMFTSGTTGRSKGVMLSQKNLFTAMPAFLTPFEDVRSQTGWNTDAFSSLSCLPMFHISAMTSLVSWSITGHCVNLCNDLKYFYRDLGAMRSDVMAVVPVLLGYYKDPEATAEVLDAEGWFHTGDIARVEPDGYMYLTGRKKNVIILGSGENVSPEELEKLLASCAAIRECRVCERNQRICAVVCCDPDQQDAVRDFVTKVNRTLPLYKHMVVEFSAQPLPRNAAGKLLRS